MKISQIETPALIVDLDVLEQNHKKLTDYLASIGMALRPHYKSHKSTVIAHYQVANGAKGITCAKLSEAEDLILSGIEDVLIANQVTDPNKIMRLAQLAACCHLSVCVDDAENIRMLDSAAAQFGSTIHCFVEYEIGMNRCGVATEAEFLELAKQIQNAKHLSFAGIQAYAGHLAHEENSALRTEASCGVEEKVRKLIAVLEQNGISVPEVSGGSTGTVVNREKGTVYTEMQAGSYLFMDAAYRRVGADFEHSLYLLAGVVSAGQGRVVCDGGMKTLGVDQGPPLFADYPNAPVEMSEEHCAAYCEHHYRTGDKLRLIPGHCCTTINLHDMLYFVRGDQVVDRIPITSRGKSR